MQKAKKNDRIIKVGVLKLKFVDFKKNIENNVEYSIYLFEGEDAYFRNRGLTLLKTAYLEEPTLNYATFTGEDNVSEILASVKSFPFMSKKRITVVSEFYLTAKDVKGELKEYLQASPLDSILVVLNQTPNKCEPLKKADKIAVIDCSKQDQALLVRWVKAECKNNGVQIEDKASTLVVEYCLRDMTRIEKETLKLISYVGDNGTITENDVKENVSMDTEYKIYELTDYIGNKKIDKALEVVYDMLSKGETTQRLLVSLYNYFSRLLHVAISDKSISELATLLKTSEYPIKKARQQSALFSKRALKKTVDMLADTDYKLKNGKLEQDQALWLSLFKVMKG